VRIFPIFVSQIKAVCHEVQMHVSSYPPPPSLQKCFGRIFSIFASKNEGTSREVQTHFGSSLPARFAEKVLGAFSRSMRPKNEAVCRGAQTHFGSSLPASYTEKVLGAIPQFARPKTKLFAVKFRRILDVHCLRVFQKKFWAQFHDCASKNEVVCCEIETHSGSSLSASFTEKVVGAIPRFMCPKTKLLAVEFRRILEVLCLQVLQKKFWAHIPRFVRPKTKLFAVKFRRILKVLCLQDLQKKLWAIFHDICVQKCSGLL